MKIVLLSLLFVLSSCAAANGTSGLSRLYEVAVSVESQNISDRERGVKEALEVLLTRVTGLTSIPQNETVTRAFSESESWYTSYRYVDREELDHQGNMYTQMFLVIEFEQELIQELIHEAGLPIWQSNRPRILAWISHVGQDGQRIILSSTSNGLLGQAIQKRGRARGITIEFPLFDLEERMQLTPSTITGGFDDLIGVLSERYMPDQVLIGNFSESPAGIHRGLWVSPMANDLRLYGIESVSLNSAAEKLVNQIADEIMQRDVLFRRGFNMTSLSVVGVEGIDSYIQVLRYLQGLEFIDEVLVVRVAYDQVEFRVRSPYSKDRFDALASSDGLLVLQESTGNLVNERVFLWRGKH